MSLQTFRVSKYFKSSLFASIFARSLDVIVRMFQKKILKPTLDMSHPIPKVQIVIATKNSPSALPFAVVPNMHKQTKSGIKTHIRKKYPSFLRVSAFPRSSNLVSKAWIPIYRSIPSHSHSSFHGIVALAQGQSWLCYLARITPLFLTSSVSIVLIISKTPFSSWTLASVAKNVVIILYRGS